jgi:hypothetical protein
MPCESVEVIDRDVFVVHADEDTPFVKGELVPMLGLPDDRVILSSELPFPAFIEQAIATSVRRSRLTLAVVSPAYLRDRWVGFAELLSRNVRDDGRGGSLVPLLLADCEVPDVLAQHATLDCRTPPQREASAARIREQLGRPEPPIEPVACPYPGMQPFTADAASRFHGRAGEIKELVGRLNAGDRDIYVIGPSGSGKSSLIAAGLIPRLASESRCRFAVRKVRPGEHPMRRLAEALACDPDDLDDVGGAVTRLLEREACERLLVFIDQLEELFAQADGDERQRFVRALGVLRADRRCHQILALRADFYGALMSSALWPDIEGRVTELRESSMSSPSSPAVPTPMRPCSSTSRATAAARPRRATPTSCRSTARGAPRRSSKRPRSPASGSATSSARSPPGGSSSSSIAATRPAWRRQKTWPPSGSPGSPTTRSAAWPPVAVAS